MKSSLLEVGYLFNDNITFSLMRLLIKKFIFKSLYFPCSQITFNPDLLNFRTPTNLDKPWLALLTLLTLIRSPLECLSAIVVSCRIKENQ